jgi:hypothetical protein
MRQTSKDLRATVKRIIDDADPSGLRKGSAPKDEYGQEVSLITARLRALRPPSVEGIEAILMDVWREQFGPFNDSEEPALRTTFRPMAEALYAEVTYG